MGINRDIRGQDNISNRDDLNKLSKMRKQIRKMKLLKTVEQDAEPDSRRLEDDRIKIWVNHVDDRGSRGQYSCALVYSDNRCLEEETCFPEKNCPEHNHQPYQQVRQLHGNLVKVSPNHEEEEDEEEEDEQNGLKGE